MPIFRAVKLSPNNFWHAPTLEDRNRAKKRNLNENVRRVASRQIASVTFEGFEYLNKSQAAPLKNGHK